jgi:hypothetical protein
VLKQRLQLVPSRVGPPIPGCVRMHGLKVSICPIAYFTSHQCIITMPVLCSSCRGSPTEFYFQAQQLSSQRGRNRGDLPSLVHNMGLEQVVLNQPWAELSVSESFPSRGAGHTCTCVLQCMGARRHGEL